MQGQFEITVNGTRHAVARAGVARPFLPWLREALGLTGTKAGLCGGGVCTGACTVCVVAWDGRGRPAYRAVSACRLTLPMAAGREFVTVEALGSGLGAHPVRRALAVADAEGCGYCAAGLSMALFEIYYRQDLEGVEDVEDALADHACRCGSARAARDAALILVREAHARRLGSPSPARIERFRRRRKRAPRIQGDAFEEALSAVSPDRGALAYIDPGGARFHRPRSLLELLRLRREHRGARLVGGGMGADVLNAPAGATGPDIVLSTEEVVEMGAVLDLGDGWEIGASVTLSSLGEAVGGECRMIGRMLGGFESRASRNRATLGGALCSPESTGEVGPAFVALGATAIIAGLGQEREMPLERFLAEAPGESLRGEEVLKAVRLPRPGSAELLWGVPRVSPRRRNAPAIACLAVSLEIDDEQRVVSARVVTGAARARPVRAIACEEALTGQPWNGATVRLAAQALREAAPAFSDSLAGGDYRRAVTVALLHRFFYEIAGSGSRRAPTAVLTDAGDNRDSPRHAEVVIEGGEASDPLAGAVSEAVFARESEGGGSAPAVFPGAFADVFSDPEENALPGEEKETADVTEEAAVVAAVEIHDAGDVPVAPTAPAEGDRESGGEDESLERIFVVAVEDEEGFGTIFVDPDEGKAHEGTSVAAAAPEPEGEMEEQPGGNKGAGSPEVRTGADPEPKAEAEPEPEKAGAPVEETPWAPRPAGIRRATLPPPRKASLDVQPRNGVVIEKEGSAP